MTKLLFIVIMVLALAALGPLLILWSLNTIFPSLAIPYTFETWAAAMILAGIFRVEVKK